MGNQIRRLTEEKELRLAGTHAATKEELEARGLIYMGSVGMAARLGYLTPRACEKMGHPVTPEELEHAGHFAMMTDCFVDLCFVDESGQRRRPCLPVFLREGCPEASSP